MTYAVSPAADPQSPYSLSQLYGQHHPWLLRWLRGKLSCMDHAADLAQDTFVKLLATPGERAVTLREPRAYLSTVARRLLNDHYRRQSLEQPWLATLAQLPAPVTPSAEERLLILETLHQIDAMLDGLGEKVRTAFLLSQLEGLVYADIATHLNVSERTVKRYMMLAFEQCILLVAWHERGPQCARRARSGALDDAPARRRTGRCRATGAGAPPTPTMKRHGSGPSKCAAPSACCPRRWPCRWPDKCWIARPMCSAAPS